MRRYLPSRRERLPWQEPWPGAARTGSNILGTSNCGFRRTDMHHCLERGQCAACRERTRNSSDKLSAQEAPGAADCQLPFHVSDFGGRERSSFGSPRIVMPPSTTKEAPVMNPESASARNAAARAISSGLPQRPTGVLSATLSLSRIPASARSRSVWVAM